MENYSWTYLKKHPKQAKRLLGIDYQQLEELIEFGKFLAQRKREDIERKKIRINRAGGGNHAKLSVEEQSRGTNSINVNLFETSFKLSTFGINVSN